MDRSKLRPGRLLQWFLILVMGGGLFLPGAVLGDQRKTLIDFGNLPEGLEMQITDDGVMGGLSKGNIRLTDRGTALFSGTLSLENNGGFSSLRMAGGDWNLEGWKGIVLKVKGDGRSYDLRMTTDERFRGSAVSFRGRFPTVEGEWITVKVPFDQLRAGWRGRQLDTPFDPSKIEGIGVILADKKPGAFALEMQWVQAWK